MRTNTAVARAPDPEPRPSGVTLDGFARGSTDAHGVRLRDLSSCDALRFRTRNSIYRLWLLEPSAGRVLVQGGTFFPQPVEATIAGATAGGSMIKVGWILQGYNLEILREGQRIVTTPVRVIQINDNGAVPGPF